MLIILIMVIAVVGVFIIKNYIQTTTKPVDSANSVVYNRNKRPADQYKYAIINSKPALVFIHSNTCDPCIEMIQIVNDVYPEFEDQVILIDVNVYDDQNQGLIAQLGINYIPTLVFYFQNGESQTQVGVLTTDELRQHLISIAGAR